MNAFICLACSQTKSPTRYPIPALHRYDGPMWRTLRAGLEHDPRVTVWFLSAKYGFQPATMIIPSYEQMLTQPRANELLRLPSSNHRAFAEAVAAAPRVMFAGGRLYRDTMARASIHRPGFGRDVTETDGPGQGYQMQALRRWLRGDDQ